MFFRRRSDGCVIVLNQMPPQKKSQTRTSLFGCLHYWTCVSPIKNIKIIPPKPRDHDFVFPKKKIDFSPEAMHLQRLVANWNLAPLLLDPWGPSQLRTAMKLRCFQSHTIHGTGTSTYMFIGSVLGVRSLTLRSPRFPEVCERLLIFSSFKKKNIKKWRKNTGKSIYKCDTPF